MTRWVPTSSNQHLAYLPAHTQAFIACVRGHVQELACQAQMPSEKAPSALAEVVEGA